MMPLTKLLSLAYVAVVTFFSVGPSHGQDFPTRPITVLVGLSAGSSPDAAMRIYGDILGRSLGQPFVIDNRPGGNSVIAAQALRQALPDGHTIMVSLSGLHTITPAMQTLPFDPIAGFEPIMLLYSAPTFLTVPIGIPANSVTDLVKLAKSRPGGLNYGSPAVGSPAHIMAALLQQRIGAPMTHVPYRGGAPLLVDLIANRVDFTFVSYANIKGALDDKKVKVLAIADAKRWNAFPDVPTMTEQGFGGIDVDPWFGLVAPPGTPKPITRKIYDSFAKASTDPNILRRMDELGFIIKIKSAEELVTLMRSDLERLSKIVKTLDISAR